MTRILFLTDLHGARGFLAPLLEQQPKADVLVLGGDLTNFGGRAEASALLTPLVAAYPQAFGVHGNVDLDGVRVWLEEQQMSLHGRGHAAGDLGFFGCGGSNHTPLNTPTEFTEDQIGALLDDGLAGVIDARFHVMVSHTPPLDTPADLMFAGKHVGSSAVRAFIERRAPLLCLCGHIHEAASVTRLNGCWVVNPGSFSTGRYAVVEVGYDGAVQASLRRVDVGRWTRAKVTVSALASKLGGFVKHRLSR